MHRLLIHRVFRVGGLIALFSAAASAFAMQELQEDRSIKGIVGLEDLAMSGRSYIDSYDSSVSGGYKASKGKDAIVLTNGEIQLSGGGGIYGNAITTRSGITLSGGSEITGRVTYSTVFNNSGNSRADAVRQSLPAIDAKAPGKCSGYTPAPTGSDPWIKGDFTYDRERGDLSVAGGRSVTLRGGTYCFNNIGLSGGSSLTVEGPVVFRMNGSISLSGGSVINKGGRPSAVQVSSASSRGGISMTGNSQAFLMVFAPSWQVGLSGGSDLFGSLVGQSIAASGGSALHYDISLGNYLTP